MRFLMRCKGLFNSILSRRADETVIMKAVSCAAPFIITHAALTFDFPQ